MDISLDLYLRFSKTIDKNQKISPQIYLVKALVQILQLIYTTMKHYGVNY